MFLGQKKRKKEIDFKESTSEISHRDGDVFCSSDMMFQPLLPGRRAQLFQNRSVRRRRPNVFPRFAGTGGKPA